MRTKYWIKLFWRKIRFKENRTLKNKDNFSSNIQLLWKHLESSCWWKVLCWSFLLCTFGWRIYITSMLFKNGTYPFHYESAKQASNLYNMSCYLFPNSPSLYSRSSEVSTSMTMYYIFSHNFSASLQKFLCIY